MARIGREVIFFRRINMSQTVSGPKAPKDPTAKRPYFYVMHDKEIYASPQADGRGIQFIYENDGRFADSARLVGNVTDEEILSLMPTTAGFRKLVHSVGVSVSVKEKENVTFVLQMYPADPADPATVISRTFLANGEEQIIDMSEVDWLATDNTVGQIRYEFAHPGVLATVDVRLYLNDGFTAPEQTADAPVDIDSAAYQLMISHAMMNFGDLSGIKKLLVKSANDEKITLAFIGGSITQGAGAIPIHEKCYARTFANVFADMFCEGDRSKVDLVKAGVGGTPSELGMVRFTRDVLRYDEKKPDIIIIEFAVNDEGDETKGECYESLVRKALALPWHPAVLLIFAVFSNDYNLQERLAPIGMHYNLPMVSVKDAVSPQFPLTPAEGRIISKNQYFYDQYHPSNNGHIVMADCIRGVFLEAANEIIRDREADEREGGAPDKGSEYQKYDAIWSKAVSALLDKPALLSGRFERVELLDKKDNPLSGDIYVEAGSFDKTDEDLQRVEMDSEIVPVPEFPNNWHYDGSSDAPAPFIIKCTCTKILGVFKDSGLAEYGPVEVYVDGDKVMEYNPLDIGWTHCNAVIICDGTERKEHEVKINMAPGAEHKKFTILGFGVVE